MEHRVKYFEKGSDTRINYFAVEADVANAWKIVLG